MLLALAVSQSSVVKVVHVLFPDINNVSFYIFFFKISRTADKYKRLLSPKKANENPFLPARVVCALESQHEMSIYLYMG